MSRRAPSRKDSSWIHPYNVPLIQRRGARNRAGYRARADDPLAVEVQNRGPLQIRKAIDKAMRAGHVLDPDRGVVVIRIAHAVRRQLTGDPLVTIQVDLDLQRKPVLHAHMHQAKAAIHEVEVQVRTLAPGTLNKRLCAVNRREKVRHASSNEST